MKSDAEAAESFARYAQFWMDREGLIPPTASDRAAKRGYQLSTTKIANILNGIYANHQMRQIEAFAIVINRPKEEVFMAALGYALPLTEHPKFTQSHMAQLWQLMEALPARERTVYDRFVQMLADDIQRTSNESSR